MLLFRQEFCDLIWSSLIPRDYLVVWNERTQVFKISLPLFQVIYLLKISGDILRSDISRTLNDYYHNKWPIGH